MLKNITIFSNKVVYLNKDYAIAFKNEDFLPRFLLDVDEEMTNRGFFERETVIDMLTLKVIAYKIMNPFPLFFALTFDDAIDPEKVSPHLQDLIESTLGFIERTNSIDEISDRTELEEEIDSIIREFLMVRPPKIGIIGDNGVGKTAICELLKGGILPDEGLQPITPAEKYFAELFDIPILLYDIRITDDWRKSSKYLVGANAVVVVLDSTLKNARYSKSLIELADEVVPQAEMLIIANKQDVEGALKPEELQDILNYKVFPFSAKPENRDKLKIQIAKLLEFRREGIDYTEEDYIIQRTD
ncbi:MAG: ADP-ribosylation factor-like protein [Candidatus Hodarchaeota archaeon]